MSSKRYKCPYCNERLDRAKLIKHVDKSHQELIPDTFTATQVVYNSVNKTTGGKCRVCGRLTKWDESKGRYEVLCNDPRCKQKLRDDYKKNMLRVKGTYNILNDPEQQKLMLANRSISGEYQFQDGGKVGYTGSYEKKCLEFMDVVMNIKSDDIMSPGPTMEYEYNGEKHVYIPDFYYIPYNLIIEVKDGGSNKNAKDSPSMKASREKTIEKERLITDKGVYNYVRLTDNQFAQLIEIFMDIKEKLINGDPSKTVRVNENTADILMENVFEEAGFIGGKELKESVFIESENPTRYFVSDKELSNAPVGGNENPVSAICLYASRNIGNSYSTKDGINTTVRSKFKQQVYFYKFNTNDRSFDLEYSGTFEDLCDKKGIKIKEINDARKNNHINAYKQAVQLCKQELQKNKAINKHVKFPSTGDNLDRFSAEVGDITIFCINSKTSNNDNDEFKEKVIKPVAKMMTEVNKQLPDGYSMDIKPCYIKGEGYTYALKTTNNLKEAAVITEGVMFAFAGIVLGITVLAELEKAFKKAVNTYYVYMVSDKELKEIPKYGCDSKRAALVQYGYYNLNFRKGDKNILYEDKSTGNVSKKVYLYKFKKDSLILVDYGPFDILCASNKIEIEPFDKSNSTKNKDTADKAIKYLYNYINSKSDIICGEINWCKVHKDYSWNNAKDRDTKLFHLDLTNKNLKQVNGDIRNILKSCVNYTNKKLPKDYKLILKYGTGDVDCLLLYAGKKRTEESFKESLLESKNEPFYFYHLVPKGANVSNGITSLEYQYNHNIDDFLNNSNKYRARLCNGWGIYPGINPNSLSYSDIHDGINQHRNSVDGCNKIYLFRYAPYKELGAQMKKILSGKDIYRVDVDRLLKDGVITSIDYGYVDSNTDNDRLDEDWYRNISYEDYFKNYTESDPDRLLFSYMNHISVTPKDGVIPKKYLTKINNYNKISEGAGLMIQNYTCYECNYTADETEVQFDQHPDYNRVKRLHPNWNLSKGKLAYVVCQNCGTRNDILINKEQTITESQYPKASKSIKLYHGSTKQGLKYISPRSINIKKELGKKDLVFASDTKDFAACFCGNWNDSIARQGSWDGWNTVTIGISDKVDMDKPCSLYELENDGEFEQVARKEFVSDHKVKVLKETQYKSYREALRANGIEVISYQEYQDRLKATKNESAILESSNDLSAILKFNQYMLDKEYVVNSGNGKVIDQESPEDFCKYYRLMSPKEFEKFGGGVCWDYVPYEAYYFSKNFPNIKYKTFYHVFNDNHNCPTHTFLLFYMNNKCYWFEASWKKYAGVYEFNSEMDALNYIVYNLSLFVDNNKVVNDYTCEYNALNQKIYGMNTIEFMNYMDALPKYNYQKFSMSKPNTIYKPSSPTNKLYNELSLLEEVAINSKYLERDDYCYNLDLWDPFSNNILYITGVSGSGKTTLAIDIAKEFNCNIVELDDIANYNYTKYLNNGNKQSIIYNCIKRNCAGAERFFDTHKYEPYNNPNIGLKVCNDFLKWFIENMSNDGNLYVINGAQIYYMVEPSYFADKPIIIKKSDLFTSINRRSQRESKDLKTYIKKYIDFLAKSPYRDAQRSAVTFAKDIGRLTNESSIDYLCLDDDEE
jgi:hypothetical protein